VLDAVPRGANGLECAAATQELTENLFVRGMQMSQSAVRKPVPSSSLILGLETQESQPEKRLGSTTLASVSLLVASLETICAFFVAASKLGILIAFTSFLSTVIISRYHADRVRIPVLATAFLGATVNLLVLWNRQRLRRAPSAAWRTKPLSGRQRRRNWVLLSASAVTILLIVAEFWIHPIHGL
jgi:hypothetical protein